MKHVDLAENVADELVENLRARLERLDVSGRRYEKAGLQPVPNLVRILGAPLAHPLAVIRSAFGFHDEWMQLSRLVDRLRHRQRNDLGPQRFQDAQTRLERSAHFRRYAIIEIRRRHPYPHSTHTGVQRRLVVGDGDVPARRITRVGSGNHTQQAGTVAHGPGERTGGIERERHRHHPAPAHPAVRRQQAHDPRDGCRAADRAAGVGTEGAEHGSRPDCDARAARRSARNVIRVPRIAALLQMLVVAVRPHGELDHRQAAEVDGARVIEPLHCGCRVVGPEIAADFRSAGRALPGHVEHVLVRERHAVQWAERFAGRHCGIGLLRGRDGLIELFPDEEVQDRIESLDLFYASQDDFLRADFAGGDGRGDFDKRQEREFAHQSVVLPERDSDTTKQAGSISKSSRERLPSVAARNWFSSAGSSSMRPGGNGIVCTAAFCAETSEGEKPVAGTPIDCVAAGEGTVPVSGLVIASPRYAALKLLEHTFENSWENDCMHFLKHFRNPLLLLMGEACH